jgi:haloacetate dehalogenase
MLESFASHDIEGPAGRLHTLRGGHGAVGQCFDVLCLWRERDCDLSGLSLPCGHYIAEEAPALLAQALNFFKT